MVANARSVTESSNVRAQVLNALNSRLKRIKIVVSPTWSTIKGGGFLRQQRDEESRSLRCAECEAHGTLGNRIWLCWLRPKWGSGKTEARSEGNDTAVRGGTSAYRQYKVSGFAMSSWRR